MADTFTKEQRSNIMRNVKGSRNKSTELKLIKYFKENKITGWRRSFKLFGRPDFVFPQRRIAIFLDGCFWHGHKCRNTTPKDNSEYWTSKINKNKLRDSVVTQTLIQKKWHVIRIWECHLKNMGQISEVLNL
jgi:DNA mismatch endonuclease (patch repair protein)